MTEARETAAPQRKMANANVSSSVLSIIASFSSGLDVFKKLGEKRKKKKRRSRAEEQTDVDELRLSRSLRQGPEDIGREYQRCSHTALGDHIAIGDAVAQTSLAEILLKLNTGLVSIITSFLGREKHDRLDLDYRSLTDLSEHSRAQTVSVLRQLYQRELARRQPARMPMPSDRRGVNSSIARDRKDTKASPKRSKIRGPMLARVVIQDSNRPPQIAIVRPSEGKRKPRSRSESRSRSSTEISYALSRATTAVANSQLSLPPTLAPEVPTQKPSRPSHHRSATSVDLPASRPRVQKTASSPLPLPVEPLRPSRSTPRLAPMYEELYGQIPPMPRTAPLPATEYRRRKETPTYYSTNSGSTKLGEIPMHKWAVPFDFDAASVMNREALANGWPRTEEDAVAKKKRGGFLRLFSRRQEVVA